MAVAQSVWPPQIPGMAPPFMLLFVAEGFTADQEDTFAGLCRNFVTAMLDTSPFGMLHAHPERIAVWRLFAASAQSGPAIGSSAADTLLGSTYDPASQALSLSESALANFVGMSTWPVAGVGPVSNPYDFARAFNRRRNLVAIIMPAPAVNGAPLTADRDADSDISNTAQAPCYIATTVSSGWEKVVLRGVVRRLGLADEFATTAGPPDPWSAQVLNSAPNLYLDAPPATPVPRTFKWYTQLSKEVVANGIPVVPYGGTQSPAAVPIALFEGGGGYQSGVYRSAADCFLRRRIGGPSVSGEGATPRVGDVVFCALCARAIVCLINGQENVRRRVTFRNQRLQFDKASTWITENVFTAFPYTPTTFSAPTTMNATKPGPWWSFTLAAGPQVEPGYDGLLITNLALQNQGSTSHAMPPVAQRIEFRDIVAVLDDGSVVPFDFGTAFSAANSPVLQINTDGVGSEAIYLYGIKLTLFSDLGGRCPVSLELSLTLTGEGLGADPADVVYSVKIYPQIALTWHRKSGRQNAVTRFRGCVRMVFNNQAMPMTMQMGGQTTSPPPASGTAPTVTSFFADTNQILPERRQQIQDEADEPRLTAPIWSQLFDYYKPDLQVEQEITAVYGPRAGADKRRARETVEFYWPDLASLPAGDPQTKFIVKKAPDQGAYDNIHLHGDMGTDPITQSGPMVHAPGCAEACVHIHWRWGDIAGYPNFDQLIGMFRFWGWPRYKPGSGLDASKQHGEVEMPLIPPNQDLTIAIANPATTRTDSLGSVLQQSGVTLDKTLKAVWYTVDVSGTLPADARQVIFEQGVGFAYRYNTDASWTRRLWLRWVRRLPSIQQWITQQTNAGMPPTDEEIFHRGYAYLRWYLLASSPDQEFSAQLPTEADMSPSGISLESL
jgi:hypothetical protein